MKTVKSVFLALSVLMGAGVKAESTEHNIQWKKFAARKKSSVWNDFAIAWKKREAEDLALAKACQEVRHLFQQIAKPYQDEFIQLEDFEFYENDEFIRHFEVVAQLVSELSSEELIIWLKSIKKTLSRWNDLGNNGSFAVLINNIPQTDMLLLALSW